MNNDAGNVLAPPSTGAGPRLAGFVLAALTWCAWAGCVSDAPGGAVGDPLGGAGGGADGRCATGVIDGVCQPQLPQGVPEDACPGGVVAGGDHFEGGGVCGPAASMYTDWACPSGWSAVPALLDDSADPSAASDIAPFAYCLPPDLPENCAPGTMAVPGEADCVRQGVDCPTGDDLWADLSTLRGQAPDYAGPIVYVAARGSSEGDGTREQPLATVQQAVDVALDGGIVAVAPGRYVGAVLLARRIAVVGACVEETTLVAPGADPTRGTITFAGVGAPFATDLTIVGDSLGVSSVRAAGLGRLQAVRIAASTGIGIVAAQGSAISVSRVVVADTIPLPDGTLGRAIVVEEGASVAGDAVEVAGNADIAVAVVGRGSTLALTRAVVRDTQVEARRGDTGGRGVHAVQGARVTLGETIVVGNRDYGVFAGQSGTIVDLADVVVRDTVERARDGAFGSGLAATEGAHVTGVRLVLERNRAVAVSASDAGTVVTLTDVLVRDTLSHDLDASAGGGVSADSGGELSMTRAVVDRNHAFGVAARGLGARVSLVDVLVRGTLPDAQTMAAGQGLVADGGADITVTRGHVVGNHDVGVFATGAGTVVDLADVVVANTQTRPSDGRGGRGLVAEAGASVVGARLTVVGNHEVAVFGAAAGSAIDLTDIEIRGTLPSTGTASRGVEVQGSASATLARALVDGEHDVGIYAVGAGAAVTATDLVVSSSSSAQSDAVDRWGLAAEQSGTLDLARMRLRDTRGVGIFLDGGAHADLADAEITSSGASASGAVAVGLQVQGASSVDASVFRVVDTTGAAVVANGERSTLAATDLSIDDTAWPGCPEPECGGIGLVASDAATVRVVDFTVTDSESVGVQVSDIADVSGERGAIERNWIGVNAQSERFDASFDLVQVRITDNGESVSGESLPVPGRVRPLASPSATEAEDD